MVTNAMLVRIALLLITALMEAVGQNRAITAKDFFAGFEGASLINPRQAGPNHFTVEAQDNRRYGNQGSLMTWACAGIRLNGVKIANGDQLRITVPNGNKSSDLRAVYSYDRQTWQAVSVQRAAFDFDIPLEPGRQAVYFATFYPYMYSQGVAHNKRLARSRYVKFSVAGKSVKGRDISLATITDPGVDDAGKWRAFLLGGTHGQENASLYGVEGMLDFLSSEDSLAREMRHAVIWKIIPIQNVDAAAEGLDRRNAAGINLYFDWGFHEEKPANAATGTPDPAIPKSDFSQPETRVAMDSITSFRPHVFLDVHSWHFAGDGYWGPDPAAQSTEIDSLKQSIAKFFRIKHWNHESYPYASAPTIARKFRIAATLPEFALSYDSEGQLKTPDSMRKQGVAILRGIYEYLKSSAP